MDCSRHDCLSSARLLPQLCLFSLVSPKEMRQWMPGKVCCQRHRGEVERELLADPWFSQYAKLIAWRHHFQASRALSRVRFIDIPSWAEAS
jgi:hypothetical protein